MQGARITSASWGGSSYVYTSDCKEIDAFARQHDMLILHAAGDPLMVIFLVKYSLYYKLKDIEGSNHAFSA